mmetsp:Transcript_21873/g.66393  ORF Transcript_21873/g.66393 Transcript_21873/m.66393 type:complete len:104 (-) Transcript_21873:1131-1442(-)
MGRRMIHWLVMAVARHVSAAMAEPTYQCIVTGTEQVEANTSARAWRKISMAQSKMKQAPLDMHHAWSQHEQAQRTSTVYTHISFGYQPRPFISITLPAHLSLL